MKDEVPNQAPDSMPLETGEQASPPMAEGPTPPEPQPEKELPRKPAQPKAKEPPGFWQRALRWVLGFLIVLGIGALAAIFLLYIPARNRINAARSELSASDQRISDLQGRIQELQKLEDQNAALSESRDALQTEIGQADLHIALLSAQVDVVRATLALVRENPSRADIHLTNTENSLQRIRENLPATQKDVVDEMKNRLESVKENIRSNKSAAAQSDLDVLLAQLVDLENDLFSGQ